MNDRILLDQPYALNGRFLFAVSTRCFNRLEQAGKDAEQTLCRLSALKMLLFWIRVRNDGEIIHNLYTTEGVYTLAQTDNAALLLTNYRPATLQDNNLCLKAGISVQAAGGITVSIKMNDAHQVFSVYHNGSLVPDIPAMTEANAALLPLLEEISSSRRSQRSTRQQADAPYHVPEAAEEYLSIAEGYTQTDADIELAKAQQTAPIVYWDFHPTPGYDRLDKTAYTAFAAPYNTEKYPVDCKVQMELDEEHTLTASLIAAGEENGEKTITLLFDEQISFSSLPKTGQLRPSYSDVQNEVRQDVIDGLRKGETAASFLADVLGSYRTSGFTHKDMRGLDTALQSKKYPPNQSQIEAIHRGIETNDILLVLGPPGTGKTTVILEWVKYFIRAEGKRVLISSQNNKAVDNVLERLTQEKGISAIRAGNEAKVQANMYPYLLENRLKQLREDVENTVSSRLEKLYRMDVAYRNYISRVNASIANLQSQADNKLALQEQADHTYAGYRTTLLEEQQMQEKLKAAMQQELQTIRLCERRMVDPEKHPILRKLLSPLRGRYGQQLTQALDAYHAHYEEYIKSVSKSRLAYKYLSTLTRDKNLLEFAEHQAELERKQQELQTSLQKPVDDSMIWKNAAWPSVPTAGTINQLSVLLEQVKKRREKLQLLKTAAEEWNDHIQSQSNYALSDLLMESVDLVGGTCIGINSQRKFSRINFDVTIIDESGQIQIHNALVPMSRSPKVIMLGDHLQIPPMADEEQVALCEESGIDTSLLSTSLFERLYENLPQQNKVLLDTQYRMPAQIADLLSEWFYNGEYKSFSGKRNMPSLCPALFASPFVVLSTSDAGKRRLEYKPEMGAGNNYEAELVIAIVTALLSGKYGEPLSASDFGIISPYGEQVTNIRRKLKKALPSLKATEIHDMVASLDSFQGQERSIILYSCTRSNQKPANRNRIGFLKELRRLNVALSRPLKELVFIGDIDFLSSCTSGEGKGSEREFSAFIELMREHAERDGEFILSTDFMKRLEAD